jgi:hypothetical protein
MDLIKLCKIYRFIGFHNKATEIEEQLGQKKTPHDLFGRSLDDNTIDKHHDLFFSTDMYWDAYLDRHGIVKTMKLFKSYGQEFECKKWDLVDFVLNDKFQKDTFDYFIKNYTFEIDWQCLMKKFINGVFSSGSFDCFEYPINYCASQGVSICDAFNSAVLTFDSYSLVTTWSDMILDLSKHPVVKLDINAVLKKLLDANISFIGNRRKLHKWLEADVDYSNPQLVSSLLRISTIKPALLKSTMEKVVETGAYDANTHTKTLLSCISSAMNTEFYPRPGCPKNPEEYDFIGEFIESFHQWGIDFDAMFHSYLHESDSDLISFVSSVPIMKYLAKKHGLLD